MPTDGLVLPLANASAKAFPGLDLLELIESPHRPRGTLAVVAPQDRDRREAAFGQHVLFRRSVTHLFHDTLIVAPGLAEGQIGIAQRVPPEEPHAAAACDQARPELVVDRAAAATVAAPRRYAQAAGVIAETLEFLVTAAVA
jgi:hypothetical protein